MYRAPTGGGVPRLRFSKKADYALIALKDLASRPPGSSSNAREIAGRYDIPVELMGEGAATAGPDGDGCSHQGTRGGYHLAREATRISVADVIQAIDGPVLVTACSDEDESCEQYAKCNVRDPLLAAEDRIVQSLAAFTVNELVSDDAPEPLPLTVFGGPPNRRSPRRLRLIDRSRPVRRGGAPRPHDDGQNDIDYVVDKVGSLVARLRQLSPHSA